MAQSSHPLLRIGGGIAAGLSFALLLRATVQGRRRLDLRGRVVIVTGGSRGLGLLIAQELGRRGARVAICGREAAAVEAAERRLRAEGIDVLARACDLGDRRQADLFVERASLEWGRIDALVNNAGAIHVAPLAEVTLDDLEAEMRSTFWSAANATWFALPHLRKHPGEARVVNVTSIGGRVAVPHLATYSAAKFAELGLSEGLHVELARSGIRVVTVIPGLMRTGSFYNAQFGGQARRELGWFSLLASLPLLSVSSRRAARRIVRALERGDREVTIGAAARLASLAHGVAPRLVLGLLSLVNRLLPGPGPSRAIPRRGREIPSPLLRSPLLRLGNRAARANNEAPPPQAR